MTNELAAEATKLTDVCRAIFGDEANWIKADGYPHSLALAIIDSIFSTGSHYQSVINVVNEYRAYRRSQGADADQDGTGELLRTFEEVGDSKGWAVLVNNHKPAHTGAKALLKAEVVRQAAEALKALDITTRAELHAEHSTDEGLSPVKEAWLRLPSQSSGVTFNYFLILAGFQSVKPDRMVIRFVEEHAGLEGKRLTSMQTAELIKKVAELYPTQPRRLDHVIWRHVSGREIFRAEELS
ncbi:hypothetical protein OIT41_08585 [Arthrobacter sp. YA7-1]|uniref:hypothetical protein n=1 Tax=Arthrobacter sp. YA7-1 TaxID=2987701 RepID=UPI00222639F9|nr:hypothetical protein [Arthrobacter sp. YA7-1]UYY83071.1 hypothetical protein OIT41_08585 [Arthrobacter sp. YA7-1]